MTVKIINADAQKLIASRIRDISELISYAMEKGRDIRYQSAAAAEIYFEEIKTSLNGAKENLASYQRFLGQHDAWSTSQESPVRLNYASMDGIEDLFGKKVYGSIFLFHNTFYEVAGPYTDEEKEVLLEDYVKKRRDKVDYLLSRKDVQDTDQEYKRLAIPESVRREVWRRDNGRCVNCESVRNLEYDHIIPVSRGGSNTARNIQLLCQDCNRAKSNKI